MNSRKLIALLLYITVIIIFFVFEPAMMFDDAGKMKIFDYNMAENTSLLSLVILSPLIAIVCYFLIIVVEMVIT